MKNLLLTLAFVPCLSIAGTVGFDGPGTGSATFVTGGTGAWTLSSSGSESGSTFMADTFTDTDSTAIVDHTGETAATWTIQAQHPLSNYIITSNRLRTSDGVTGCVYASGIPVSADYSVTALVYQAGSSILGMGPAGRISTSANTMYAARYVSASGEWQLLRMVSGTASVLGQFAATTSNTVTYTVKLEMVGSSIKVYLNGSEIISVTDTQIPSAGRAGVRGVSQSGGHHIASISATNN